MGIAVAAGDTIYVANCRNSPNASIAKVTPNGVSSIFVSSSLLDCPNGLTIDPDGNLYTCNFNNGRELASGVYLYRLEAGEYTLTRKMLLLN